MRIERNRWNVLLQLKRIFLILLYFLIQRVIPFDSVLKRPEFVRSRCRVDETGISRWFKLFGIEKISFTGSIFGLYQVRNFLSLGGNKVFPMSRELASWNPTSGPELFRFVPKCISFSLCHRRLCEAGTKLRDWRGFG